jgi:hypothetical protein
VSTPPRRYWFPAKRYGWGWGSPTTWQGWLVLVVWLAITIPTSLWLGPQSTGLFLLFILGMCVVLGLVCYLTGEPPRWRWGDDGRPNAPRS